ncbi:MAG: hypothetical protein KDD37_02625 [Bdellovibrionales bacterium]|nr:hypothetical protein [Bdellovibrionales bacterium]
MLETNDLFIGIKTFDEITSFYNGYPVGVTQVACDYEPDAISPTELGPGDYYSESSVITISGVNRPVDILIRGYQSDDGSAGGGTLYYKVNGGSYVAADDDYIEDPPPASCEYISGGQYGCLTKDAYITVNDGDTIQLRFNNSSGSVTLPILIYNLSTSEEIDTFELSASEI